jgi:hypothetical protein
VSPRRYVRAARVLTCASRGLIEDGVVAMEDASIVAVGPAADFQPEMVGQVVEQFPTGTLLPGLIEADAHLTLFANREPYERMFEEPDEMMALVSVRNLQRHLASGVTTIRDNGGRNRVTFVVREALRRAILSVLDCCFPVDRSRIGWGIFISAMAWRTARWRFEQLCASSSQRVPTTSRSWPPAQSKLAKSQTYSWLKATHWKASGQSSMSAESTSVAAASNFHYLPAALHEAASRYPEVK